MSEKPKYDWYWSECLGWNLYEDGVFMQDWNVRDIFNTQAATIARLEAENAELRGKLVCAGRFLEFAKNEAKAFDSKNYENRINYTAFRSLCTEASLFIPVEVSDAAEGG